MQLHVLCRGLGSVQDHWPKGVHRKALVSIGRLLSVNECEKKREGPKPLDDFEYLFE